MENKTCTALFFYLTVFLSAASMTAPALVEGAESHFQPSVLLSEEYNDNIFLSPTDRFDDYITRIVPSFQFAYRAPFWDWDVSYAYDYRYYVLNKFAETDNHRASLANQTRIVQDLFFLKVQDDYTRVSLDVSRDFTQESNLVHQSDQNIFITSPYLVLTLSNQTRISTGYLYRNIWYKDPASIGLAENTVYAELGHDLMSRMSMTIGARHTLDENRLDDFTRDDAYLGLLYEFANDSTISAMIGYSWFDFEISGRNEQMYWDAILTKRFPKVTIIGETSLRYIPDPQRGLTREDRYVGTIRKDDERTSLAVSGGVFEYREIVRNNLENTVNRVTVTGKYAVTRKSAIIMNVGVDWNHDYLADIKTERFLGGARYEYSAGEKLLLALDYKYSDVYSPDSYLDNYYNNRVSVEVQKSF